MIFYAILIVLEKFNNEYLIRNFQTTGTTESRIKSIDDNNASLILFLFLGLVFMIKRQKSDDKEAEGPDYKFASKLDSRPAATPI